MNMLRACAARYPRFFHDFRPRLNSVLLERHRQGIQNRRVKTLNEAPLQPHRDFDIITLTSAVPDENVETSWITSEDGHVLVDAAGTLLKDVRPNHYRMHLLRRDRYGLLAARGEECAPSSPQAIEPTTNPAGFPSSPDQQHQSSPVDVQGPIDCESRTNSNGDTPSNLPTPSNLTTSPDIEWGSDLHEQDWGLSAFASSFDFGPYSACNHLEMWTPRTGQVTSDQNSTSPAHCFPDPAAGLLRPVSFGSLVQDSDNQGLRLGSLPVVSEDPLTVEEALHSRYHDMITTYIQKVSSEAEQTGAGDQRKLRAQWLSPSTTWASVWTQPESGLPRGGARSWAEADVLYLTSDEAVRAAQKCEVFRRPIVIKEKFSDSGMHTVHKFALLWQAGTNAVGHATTVSLRNITQSHRPLLIMLPRFRLLDSLVERVRGGDLGDQTLSKLVDIASHTSFNTLSLTGAFSGARLATMSGVWMRNLDGVKFCTLVPEDATVLDWETLANMGRNWAPNGKQKFLVLEQDDVLLIPPGLRVAYAMHSPTNGVMEGGIFWDSLNVVEILHSAHWICKCGLAWDEPIAYRLPRFIAELEVLVKHQSDHFRGDRSESDFMRAFELAISKFADLGSCGSLLDLEELCTFRGDVLKARHQGSVGSSEFIH
ncbi:hypothetical protein DM02DRAFT_589887 [Periconia macrospinosa]|uniref:JmjC domain-containing protein n=1 Tax=Periconia macrospinosa TaxID=97972 RepID=A0A2V1DVZ1_9PLEO|nr:hypothetical protein DM02DRAFT_589887 [Periconia macrospinosa]